jgi:hypothetical protein
MKQIILGGILGFVLEIALTLLVSSIVSSILVVGQYELLLSFENAELKTLNNHQADLCQRGSGSNHHYDRGASTRSSSITISAHGRHAGIPTPALRRRFESGDLSLEDCDLFLQFQRTGFELSDHLRVDLPSSS